MNKSGVCPVFIFEGRRTVTEQTLASEALVIERTGEDTLEAVVRENARMVFRIAFSVVGNHQDAEDITQETFMRVLRYRRKLEGIREPKPWIARIAWRLAVERGKRRADLSLSEKEIEQAAAQLRTQLASAEDMVVVAEVGRLLEFLIEALPETLRAVLRLSTIQQLQGRDIALILGIGEASVRSRLFRARQLLKEKLRELEGSHGRCR
jgi:RNA polymerase sigma-70 factor (ECF subfamily)